MEKYNNFRIFWNTAYNNYEVVYPERNKTAGYASTLQAAKKLIDNIRSARKRKAG